MVVSKSVLREIQVSAYNIYILFCYLGYEERRNSKISLQKTCLIIFYCVMCIKE